MKAITRLFGAAALMAALSACATPFTYSAEDIRGQIMDAETGEPIEGVIVVAQWVLFHSGVGHGGHKSRLHIHETLTGKDGRYFIPGWGPKVRPPLTELANRDPEILIFKSGYEPKRLQNSEMDNSESVRVSEWDGKVVKLKRFQGTLEEYAKQLLYGISTSLSSGSGNEWRSFPRMVLALYEEDRRLKSLGLKPGYRATSFNIEYFNEADRAYLRKFEE